MPGSDDKIKTIQVPKVLFEYLDECNERDDSCRKIEVFAWVLAVVLAVILVVAYYHIQSMGGINQVANNSLRQLTNGFTEGTEDFAQGGMVSLPTPTNNPNITPVPAHTYGQGDITEGNYENCVTGPNAERFNEDERLDYAIVQQKIDEYDSYYGDKFVPTDAEYAHERFMTDEALDPAVTDSHRDWAHEIKGKNLSLTALVDGFDPEEALTGVGIRHLKPRNPPSYGLQAGVMSLYDPNDNQK